VLGDGEIAGAPEVPAGDGAPGLPFFCATLHDVRLGEEVWGNFGGGLESLEGEGEAFADTVVGGGEDVRTAEAEDEEHLDGPLADASNLGEVVDDFVIGHAANAGQGRDGGVEGFGGEVAEGEGFVGGEAGGAEFGGGDFEDLCGSWVDGRERGHGLEAGDEAGVDGGSGFAVELLVDDGLGEGFKWGLVGGEAEGEGAGAGDEFGEFGVGGGEGGGGYGWIVRELAAGAAGVRHERNDTLTGSYNFSYKWGMELKVRKIGNGYGVLFPKQLMEEMHVEEGSLIELNKVDGGHVMKPVDEQFSRQVEAFLRTEQRHRNTYRELAK